MIQHAYRLPLTFQPISLKWVDLIGPLSEPMKSSYTVNSVWGHGTDDLSSEKVNLPIAFAV